MNIFGSTLVDTQYFQGSALLPDGLSDLRQIQHHLVYSYFTALQCWNTRAAMNAHALDKQH